MNNRESARISDADVLAAFLSPKSEARPFARWWWHDNRIAKDELQRELDLLAKAGFGGVEINSLSFPRHDTPNPVLPPQLSYGSPEFWSMVAFAASEARSRGMIPDMILGSGWPFAAEWLAPEHRVQGVAGVERSVSLSAQEAIELHAFSGDDSVTAAYRARECSECEILFATAIPVDASSVDDNVALAHSLEIRDDGPVARVTVPAGEWRVRVGFRLQGDCFKVNIEGVEGGMGHVLDHYSAEAVRTYLDWLSASYREAVGEPMGNRLRALFVDSIEIGGANWATGIAEFFLKHYGYELDPFLPFVFTTGHNQYDEPPYTSAEARASVTRARQHYNETLVALFEERFVKTVAEWVHDQGCLFRYQAYGMPHYLGVAQGARHADIPESENWVYNPHTDRAYRSKLVDAAVHLAGRKLHSSESATSARGGFKASLSDVRSLCDYQSLAGVTHPIMHGIGYCPPEVPFPGHARFPTYFNERNTFWPYVRLWADYQARLDAVLQACESIAQVLIVLPEADAWAERGLGISALTRPTWYNSRLWEVFASFGYTADYMPDTIIAEGEVNADTHRIACGAATYRAVVLPELTRLDARCAALLEDAAGKGVPVIIIGDLPSVARRDEEDRITQQHIKTIARAAVRLPPPNEEEDLVAWLEPAVSKLTAPPIRVSNPVSGVLVRSWGAKGGTVVQVARPHQPGVELYPRAERSARIGLITGGGACSELDANAGTIVPRGADPEIALVPRESRLFFVSGEASGKQDAATRENSDSAKHERLAITGPWSATFDWPDGKTDTAVLEEVGSFALREDWIADFSGTCRLSTVVRVEEPGAVDSHCMLDLGDVSGLATVRWNGRHLATLWHPPFQLQIAPESIGTVNELVIELVTPLWNWCRTLTENPAVMYWIRWTNWHEPLGPIRPREPSGLLGHVTLELVRRK